MLKMISFDSYVMVNVSDICSFYLLAECGEIAPRTLKVRIGSNYLSHTYDTYYDAHNVFCELISFFNNDRRSLNLAETAVPNKTAL